MELEFEITKTDYENFYKDFYKNELRKKIKAAILIPLLIGVVFGGQPFDWTKFILATIISGVIYLTFYYVAPYFLSINRLRKEISKEPRYLEKKKIKIADDGLYFETATRSGIWRWESIESFKSHEQYISLLLADKKNYLIPKRAFTTENEVINFLGIVQSQIIKFKETSKLPIITKPPYVLGIACLIPGIGAIIGVLFVIMGISKYKDKWFTLIGVFGIVFTIIITGVTYPEIWNEKVKNEKNTEQAKVWMNNLIEDIEFYKIKSGKYPESLDNFESYSIYDPTQDIGGKNKYFNYKLIGDKYLLFSSGIDRIPNTKDDIYPEICVVDNSKIGLLKYTCKPDTTERKTNKSTNR
ncbi:MAG: YcxB family protein [Paludibacter sp.]